MHCYVQWKLGMGPIFTPKGGVSTCSILHNKKLVGHLRRPWTLKKVLMNLSIKCTYVVQLLNR